MKIIQRKPPIHLNQEEKQKIKYLKASGYTYHNIGIKLGRDPKTIKLFCLSPVIEKEITDLKQDLSDIFEDTARRMIESVTDEDILKINAYQRMVSAGIATDKMRLLRNESTENVSVARIDTNIKDLKRREEELLVSLKDSGCEE